MKRRIGTVVLMLTLFLLLCFSAYADSSEGIGATSGTCGSNLTWALSGDGTLTISGTGAMSNYSSSTGTPWEARKSSVKKLVVNSGATTLGDNAFSGCVNLSAVTLPRGLKTVGSDVFSNCDALVSITFPNTVTSLGSYCFNNCDKLRTVKLSNSLTSIGSYAFFNCDALAGIELPDSLTTLGSYAFQSCNNFQTVKLSSGLTDIPYDGFYDCAISELTIPEGISSIGSYAFYSNNPLTTLYLPSTLENVSSGAFSDCTNLTDVYFAGTKAQAEAIQIGTGNTNLSSATWHCSNGDSQGIGATSGTCGSNLTWALSGDGTLTISGTGAMTNYTESSGTPWEARKSSIKKLVVNSGATTLGDYAFSGCVNLSAVTLPSGLKTVGSYVFSGCDALVSITFPNTVTSLGDYCFSNCDKLRTVKLSSTLTSIGSDSFSSCSALTEIELPNSLTTLGSSAFYWCPNLQTVKLSSGMTGIPSGGFQYCAISELTIPEGISSIDESAFYNNPLTRLYLPSTLENVSSGAFGSCTNLTDVYFAGTKAQAEAIQIGTGNTNLSSATWHFNAGSQNTDTLTLPAMLATIESEAFAGVGAKTIVVPASVDEIQSRAFANCPNLETLSFEGSPFSIASDILSGCGSVTVSVVQGSSAERWAKRYGFPVVYH